MNCPLTNLHQLINTPTHILLDSESYIDLLFISQPNFLAETGVHASLFPRCHHQIIFAKVSLKVFYPPPYERLVWDYSKAELSDIREIVYQLGSIILDCQGGKFYLFQR